MGTSVSVTTHRSSRYHPQPPPPHKQPPKRMELHTIITSPVYPTNRSDQPLNLLTNYTHHDTHTDTPVSLSDFELLGVIGKGGFGRVWQGIHMSSGRMMALKQVSKAMILKSDNRVKMIHNERRVMLTAAQQHGCSYLTPLLYAFQTASDLYLVMDYMSGGDLRFHICERNLLNLPQLQTVAAELLVAIHQIHQNNVVYRDCKPENILLDSAGHIQLVDFGLSVRLTAEQPTVTGKIGTTGYQPAEMMLNHAYGREVDWFSFGVTLYELFHGRRPWSSDYIESYIAQHQSGTDSMSVPSLAPFHISSRASPALRVLLTQLLQTDRLHRLCQYDRIRTHPFFHGVCWPDIEHKQHPGVLRPTPNVHNFDVSLNNSEQSAMSKQVNEYISPSEQQKFSAWQYNGAISRDNMQNSTQCHTIDELSTAMSPAPASRALQYPTSAHVLTPPSHTRHSYTNRSARSSYGSQQLTPATSSSNMSVSPSNSGQVLVPPPDISRRATCGSLGSATMLTSPPHKTKHRRASAMDSTPKSNSFTIDQYGNLHYGH